MRIWCATLLLLGLPWASMGATGQELKVVGVCDLFADLAHYDGKLLAVRGVVVEKYRRDPGFFYIDELVGPNCRNLGTGAQSTVRIGLLVPDDESLEPPMKGFEPSSRILVDKAFEAHRKGKQGARAIVTVIGILRVGKDLATKRRLLMGYDDGALSHRPYRAEIIEHAMRDPVFLEARKPENP